MTTTPTPASADGLTAQEAELQARARAFVDEFLIPLEEEAERAHGRLPADAIARVKRESLERGLSGGLHSAEHGGQGWTHVEWFLVEEQFGRSTNAISWHVPTAYNVLAHGSPEQIERYLKPGLRGETHDAYAVTEENAGSDPSGITHDRRADRQRLADPRRQVVRHLRRRRVRLHRDGERAGRRRVAPDAVPRRP